MPYPSRTAPGIQLVLAVLMGPALADDLRVAMKGSVDSADPH
jgi:hypothetical protein